MARTPKLNSAIIGRSGLDVQSGFIVDDFLPQLVGLGGTRIYREMSDNDPVIGAALYAITMLLRGVEWKVEPAEDSGTQGEEAKEYVEQVLFEDMSHPWSDFIAECVSFLPYGYSLFEIVYKLREGPDTDDPTRRSKFTDNRIGIRKLSFRAQETIWRWRMQDDGGLEGVEQMTHNSSVNGGIVFIPIEKLLLFRTTTRKSNPEGRSVLRNSYVSWMRKNSVENAEGRAAMRSAGVVQIKIPSEYMVADADNDHKQIYNAYKTMADRLAQDRQGSIILPSDKDENGNELFSMAYVATDGRRPADMSAIIERYDKRIASTLLTDFILLGQQSVGSFALSSDKTALFGKSLEAFLTMIKDVVERVLLHRLWKLNAFDFAVMPKLVPGKVEAESLTEIGAFLQALGGAGMPLFPDEALENRLREAAHLPPPSDELRERADTQAEQEVVGGEASVEQQQAAAELAAKEAKKPPKKDAE